MYTTLVLEHDGVDGDVMKEATGDVFIVTVTSNLDRLSHAGEPVVTAVA